MKSTLQIAEDHYLSKLTCEIVALCARYSTDGDKKFINITLDQNKFSFCRTYFPPRSFVFTFKSLIPRVTHLTKYE